MTTELTTIHLSHQQKLERQYPWLRRYEETYPIVEPNAGLKPLLVAAASWIGALTVSALVARLQQLGGVA